MADHRIIPPEENAAAPGVGATSRGNVVSLAINVPDVDEVRAAGFDRIAVERSTNSGLTWAAAGPADQRPALVGRQVDYAYRDLAGDPNYLYRVRYYSSDRAELAEPGPEIPGAGLLIRDVLTVAQLKARYLFGVDLTNDAGEPLSDEVFRHYIVSAVRWFEHQLDIPLFETQFVNERHDYYRGDWQRYQMLQLDNYPLLDVQRFVVQYPSGQNVVEFPPEWLRVERAEGVVSVVPTAGTLSNILLGQGGSFLPAVYNGLDYLPQLFAVTYTAGFAPGTIPRNIIDLIGKFASLGPFNIFGDLIAGAGIATLSLSMDGLSQTIGTTSSATNAGFGARIIQYGKDIKAELPLLRSYYKRVGKMVIG